MARIMIVEDEPITAADLEQKLTALGHAVTDSVDSGEDAVAHAAQQAPDLVLMDIRLRGAMNGIDAAQQIRAHSDVPIVFLTAFADQETVDRACATLPFGYLLKPFTDRAVASAVQVALTRARTEHAQLQRERWMEAALRGAGEALIAVDEHAAIRFVNADAESLLHVKASDVLGRDARQLVRFASDTAGDAPHPLDVALREGRVTSSKGRELQRLSGEAPVRVAYSAAPVLAARGGKAGAVLVLRATERATTVGHELGEALSSLPMRLSHEINNPLTYNLGALRLALRELDQLRAMTALTGDAAAAAQLHDRLQRIESLLHSAQEGATRIAAVVGELGALAPARVEAAPAGAQEPAHAARGSVLVVDDEPMIGRVLEITLRTEHDVKVVSSAHAALALLERGHSFDVILCDVSMPGMDGRELYEQLSITKPELAARMVFMSGGATTERNARFLEAMTGRRIDKPFEAEQLLRMLRARVQARGADVTAHAPS